MVIHKQLPKVIFQSISIWEKWNEALLLDHILCLMVLSRTGQNYPLITWTHSNVITCGNLRVGPFLILWSCILGFRSIIPKNLVDPWSYSSSKSMPLLNMKLICPQWYQEVTKIRSSAIVCDGNTWTITHCYFSVYLYLREMRWSFVFGSYFMFDGSVAYGTKLPISRDKPTSIFSVKNKLSKWTYIFFW